MGMENAAREHSPAWTQRCLRGVARRRWHGRARAAGIVPAALVLSICLAPGETAAEKHGRSPPTPHGADAAACGEWAMIAAQEAGVPVDLMRAIARVESGRRDAAQPGRSHPPWPWTVGTGSGGRWFATAREARAFALARLAAGDEVDIGCFQLNHRWHGRAFESLDAMFAPDRNARYAARFLAALHAEFGDWTRAAAAYHSRTPEHGRAYLARLAAVLGTMRTGDTPATDLVAPRERAPVAGAARRAAGPLVALAGAGTDRASRAAPGSLVVPGAQGRPLIDPSRKARP
jgi:hypothetical protein